MIAEVRVLLRCLKLRWELSRYTPRTAAVWLRKRGVQVGEDCFIAPDDLHIGIDPWLLKIGNHVAVAAGVKFLTHDNGSWVLGAGLQHRSCGPIVVEDNCFIGVRAIIYPNVRIGPNAVVAAGSVVVSDVPPNSVVMGVPARPFGSLEKYREKCIERWALQRPPGVCLQPGETWWNSCHADVNSELLRRHLLDLFHQQLG